MEKFTPEMEQFVPFQYFKAISMIPRGSYNEEAVANYLVEFAETHELWYIRDEKNNVFMKKPGTKGMEDKPAVIIQGHTDMVCEKNSDSDHNFETDPIDLYIEDGFLKARGTTLGADNGLAVAYMLAILASDNLAHPPLECLFTSMEEVGLIGAFAFDTKLIDAKLMLNIDSPPEGILLASSAGGGNVMIRLPKTEIRAREDSAFLKLEIRGLNGGHSGIDIDKERANANSLLGRVLTRLIKAEIPFEVANISGGAQFNAIPRESDALLAVCDKKVNDIVDLVKALEREIKAEYRETEPNMSITLTPSNSAEVTLDKETTFKIATLLNLLPTGPVTRSIAMGGLVLLSNNVGVVSENDECIEINCSMRSSVATGMAQLSQDLQDIATLVGAESKQEMGFPIWEFDPDSKLRPLMLEVYKEVTGKEAKVEALHAGLECAIFAEEIPGMDIVAMGPNVYDLHTPDERMEFTSFVRTYDFVLKVLERLGQ